MGALGGHPGRSSLRADPYAEETLRSEKLCARTGRSATGPETRGSVGRCARRGPGVDLKIPLTSVLLAGRPTNGLVWLPGCRTSGGTSDGGVGVAAGLSDVRQRPTVGLVWLSGCRTSGVMSDEGVGLATGSSGVPGNVRRGGWCGYRIVGRPGERPTRGWVWLPGCRTSGATSDEGVGVAAGLSDVRGDVRRWGRCGCRIVGRPGERPTMGSPSNRDGGASGVEVGSAAASVSPECPHYRVSIEHSPRLMGHPMLVTIAVPRVDRQAYVQARRLTRLR